MPRNDRNIDLKVNAKEIQPYYGAQNGTTGNFATFPVRHSLDMSNPSMKEVYLTRKFSAKSALHFFSTNKIKSTNIWWHSLSLVQRSTFFHDRDVSFNAISDVIDYTLKNRVGNCYEKAVICYLFLKKNPWLIRAGVVTLCTLAARDHTIVVVSDSPIRQPVRLSELPQTTMVVDGWTEDWYFPNINYFDALSNNMLHLPNFFQGIVRVRVQNDFIKPCGYLPEFVPKVSNQIFKTIKTSWFFGQ